MSAAPDPRLAPGANNPPSPIDDLADYRAALATSAAPAVARGTQLLDALASSKIDSDDTAAAATTLGNLIRSHGQETDTERETLRKPWRDRADAVQAAYNPTVKDMEAGVVTAKRMLDAWADEQRARAVAERRKAEEAAAAERHLQAEAEAKKRAAEEAGDGKAALDAELEALAAQDRATALEQDDTAIRPSGMIRTQAGSAGQRTERVAEITDLRKCVAALYKAHRQALLEAVQPIVARLTRAKVALDGVTVTEKQTTTLRR